MGDRHGRGESSGSGVREVWEDEEVGGEGAVQRVLRVFVEVGEEWEGELGGVGGGRAVRGGERRKRGRGVERGKRGGI